MRAAAAGYTVTLEERARQTLLVVHDLYPLKEALDEDIGSERRCTKTLMKAREWFREPRSGLS